MSTSHLRLNHEGTFATSVGQIPVWNLAAFGILFAAGFFNLIALDSEKVEVKLDVQVYIKLAIIAASGLFGFIGFLIDVRIRRAALSFPAAWVLVISGLYMVSSLFGRDPTSAIVSTISLVSVYLMTIAATVSLGRFLTIKAIFWAAALFIFFSWIVFLLMPELGVMEEPIEGGEYVKRMSGLSHANTLGQFSAITCFLGVYFYISKRNRGLLNVAVISIALGALFCSFSRSSIMAFAVALAFVYRRDLFKSQNLPNWIVVGCVALVGLMAISTQVDIADKLLESSAVLSKSGDSEELATATGRAEIWAKSIDLIWERPVLGYGPTASKYLLDEYSYYTHNLILNVGLSSGVLGMLVAIIMCLSRIGMLFSKRSAIADGLAVLILFNGIFENVIFANLCGLPTICWVLALVWYEIDDGESD